ncbi:MAG: alpha/beta hydrolase family protein [Gemmatimonadaceae bacterium]
MTENSTWRVAVGDDTTSAIYEPAIGEEQGVFMCAHGAGGNMNDRATAATATAMREIGLGVVRFNFLYKEKGRGGPDPMPKLMSTYTAVVDHARRELNPQRLIIGGRSMGGRTASMLAAEAFDADGLLLLAYPLHPPGQHDKLRVEHLPSITMPVLCFNGTRDAFCEPSLMKNALEKVRTRWTMHWIDDADHGFKVPKRTGRTESDVMIEIRNVTEDWLQTIWPGKG